jgi:uncharacterized membrane protein
MFRFLAKYFATGLMAILPFALVIWILYIIFQVFDGLLGPYVDHVFGFKIPGLGFVLVVAIVTLFGALTHLYVSHQLIAWVEWVFTRIPYVKSMYSMFKELVQNVMGKQRGFQRVVLVWWPDQRAQIIGFVTSETLPAELDPSGSKVAVYLPNAFQWAGATVIVERDRVTDCDLTIEDGFKIALSAGLSLPNLSVEKKSSVEAASNVGGSPKSSGGLR